MWIGSKYTLNKVDTYIKVNISDQISDQDQEPWYCTRQL